MAKAPSFGDFIERGFGWLRDSLQTSRQPGSAQGEGLPTDVPGHDFLDRAWGFEREPPSKG